MSLIKLGDVCDFINGGAWSDKEYVQSGIPVLKVSNCKNMGFQLDDINYLPFALQEKYSKNELRIGDVIIATVGSHPNLVESAAGRACVVTKVVQGFYLNQNAVCLRTKSNDDVDQRYLGYLCKTREFVHYIQNRGKGAANQMRIAIGAIKDYALELPSIDIQRRIADILSAYDDLIENNQKQIKLLEEAAHRLYKEWFVDLHFPGWEHTKITDGIPDGWESAVIADICQTIGGGTPSTKVPAYYEGGTIPWVTPTDITHSNSVALLDTEKKITEEGLKNSSAKMLPAETVLMTSRASVGYFGIYPYEVCTNQGFISCIPNSIHLQMYLLSNLMERVEEIRQKAGGSTYLEISKKAFRDMNIIVPSEIVLNRFQQYAYDIFLAIREKEKANLLLQEARDRLLPKLMSGELEV